MKQLLRTVTAGFTEHSLVVRPNTLEFEVAFGNIEGLWDAPYSTWHSFDFDGCFLAADGAAVGGASVQKL